MKRLTIFVLALLTLNTMAQLKPIPTGVYHLADLPVTKSEGREGRVFMEGTTALFSYFELHTSKQFKGAMPRPGHTQTDIEELIFVKEGSMAFTMNQKTVVLGKGSMILIPPLDAQALKNVGDGDLVYYVMMFRSVAAMDIERSKKAGGYVLLNADSLLQQPSSGGIRTNYINRPTAMLNNLEVHLSYTRAKGLEAKTSAETSLIIILEGEADLTLSGKTVKAVEGDVCFIDTAEPYSIASSKALKYLTVGMR